MRLIGLQPLITVLSFLFFSFSLITDLFWESERSFSPCMPAFRLDSKGLYLSFPTFVRDYRIKTMFQIKSIMPLPLLGSVAAGHRTIWFFFFFFVPLGFCLLLAFITRCNVVGTWSRQYQISSSSSSHSSHSLFVLLQHRTIHFFTIAPLHFSFYCTIALFCLLLHFFTRCDIA
jgi:hypothetical protein